MSTGRGIVERVHRLWSGGPERDVELLYAEEFVAWLPESSERSVWHGRAGVLMALRRLRLGFPDWREDIIDLIEQGDRVVSRYRSSGTHLGRFSNLGPTGRVVEIEGISIFALREGQVVEQWTRYDELARLDQLGGLLRRRTPGEQSGLRQPLQASISAGPVPGGVSPV